MCGIVGYVGFREAEPFLMTGLKRLEYRGYDSAGIALNNEGNVEIIKSVGRIDNLESLVALEKPLGKVGMGHSRWATHGKPSNENAHPHSDCSGNIAVIHNGIIENYIEIKERLQCEGHVFVSETDTEVAAHLVESLYKGDLVDAVFCAIKQIKGAYSFVFMAKDEPSKLVAARQQSPLIVGYGEGENFVASDIPALLGYASKVSTLEDGDVAVVTADSIVIYDKDRKEVTREQDEVTLNVEAAEKGGFDHFMIKEIHEQPEAIRRTLVSRIDVEESTVNLDFLNLSDELLQSINKIVIISCGTASYAGQIAKFAFENFARIPTEVDLASEFRYRNPIVDGKTLAIVISQSGETADTLAGLREAKRHGAVILSITNVVNSSVARESDHVFYTWAGPEIAVASTKAYMTQLVSLYLIAIKLGLVRGKIDAQRGKELVAQINEIPEVLKQFIEEKESWIKKFASSLKDAEHVFYMGRGMDYATCLEGALKLKEISYIHSEAYAAGELKHGSIALIDEATPVVALVIHQKEKTLSNILEVKARGAYVIAIGFDCDDDVKKSVDVFIPIPKIDRDLIPMVSIVPLQLLAYYVAVARGTDIDKPRNLAKSVTVE